MITPHKLRVKMRYDRSFVTDIENHMSTTTKQRNCEYWVEDSIHRHSLRLREFLVIRSLYGQKDP